MGLIYFPGSGYRQSDVFGDRNGNHYGIDFAAPIGTDIPAAAAGIVWRTGYSETAGFFMVLKHTGVDGSAFFSYYFHMNGNEGVDSRPQGAPAIGTQVKAGERIGEVGNTGESEGAHLHFEVGTGIGPESGDNAVGVGVDTADRVPVDPDKFNKWPLGGPYDGGVCSDPNYHERSFSKGFTT